MQERLTSQGTVRGISSLDARFSKWPRKLRWSHQPVAFLAVPGLCAFELIPFPVKTGGSLWAAMTWGLANLQTGLKTNNSHMQTHIYLGYIWEEPLKTGSYQPGAFFHQEHCCRGGLGVTLVSPIIPCPLAEGPGITLSFYGGIQIIKVLTEHGLFINRGCTARYPAKESFK